MLALLAFIAVVDTVISTPPPRTAQAAENGLTIVVDESVIRPVSLEEARRAGLTIVTDQSIIRQVSSDGTNSRVRPTEEPPSRPQGEGPNKRRRHGCTNNDNTASKRTHPDGQAASSSGNEQRRKCARRHMFVASTQVTTAAMAAPALSPQNQTCEPGQRIRKTMNEIKCEYCQHIMSSCLVENDDDI